MNDYQMISELLVKQCDAKIEKIVNASFPVKGLSILELREALIMVGRIHLEDLDEQIYIALIPGGIKKKNIAYVGLKLTNDVLYISAYSEEGLIKQNTSKGVIDEIANVLEEYIQ